AAGIDASLTVGFYNTAAVAHQSAGRGELTILVGGGHRVAECQSGKLCAADIEKDIRADHERACSQLGQCCEHRIEVALRPRMQDMRLQSERPRGSLQVLQLDRGVGVGRIDEQTHDGHRGDQLVQQFQTLWHNLDVEHAGAREVAARAVEAANKSKVDRVV